MSTNMPPSFGGAPPERSAPNRSRIVIPVGEQPFSNPKQQARTARRRRLGKVLGGISMIVGAVVIIAAIGGFFWWRSYKQSPAYSLARIVDAAGAGDTQTFNGMIDFDAVARGFVPQIAAQGFGRIEELPEPLQRQIMNTLPQVMPGARDAIAAELQRTLAQSAQGVRVPVGVLALLIPRVATIEQNGDAATATFTNNNRATQLTLARDATPGQWRIVGVTDEQLAAYLAAQIGNAAPVGNGKTLTAPRPAAR